MGDPLRAFADAGNLVLQHVAAGRELGGHARRRRRYGGRAPHSARAGSDPAGCRLRSAGSGLLHRPSCCARRSPGFRVGPARVLPWPGTWRGLRCPVGTCRVAAGSPRLRSPGPGRRAAPGRSPPLLRTACACGSRRSPARRWPGRGYADSRPRGSRRCRNAPPGPTARHCRAPRRPRTHGRVRRDSRWIPARSSTDPNPPHPAQARAARVTRSCSRRWPPVSIVPNAAAEPGADTMNAITTRDARSLNRQRCTAPPPRRAPPEWPRRRSWCTRQIVVHTRWRRPHPGGVTTA